MLCKFVQAQDFLGENFQDDLTFALRMLVVELDSFPDSFKLKDRVTNTVQSCLVFLESLDNKFFLTFNCDETLCLAVLVLGWDSWIKEESRFKYYVFEPLTNILNAVPL
jgi:hypothetical protein